MDENIKVLLVDDEAAFRVTTLKILEREGILREGRGKRRGSPCQHL